MTPSRRTRFVPVKLVFLQNLGQGEAAVEVGLGSQIEALEGENRERERERGSGGRAGEREIE
jgi:hypothetical protein